MTLPKAKRLTYANKWRTLKKTVYLKTNATHYLARVEMLSKYGSNIVWQGVFQKTGQKNAIPRGTYATDVLWPFIFRNCLPFLDVVNLLP